MGKEGKQAPPKEYRALRGMNYKNSKGEELRVEAGDKIEGMTEDDLRHQINVKGAEVWRERNTENVEKSEDVPVQVTGVLSRHANGGADIVLRDASDKYEEDEEE